MLADGTTAPDFTLPDQDGTPVSLDDLRGRWIVMWWFPKAATSGWTLEGRGFRDRAPKFEEAGAEIVGVSFDAPEKNKRFRENQGFPFRLLSDVDRSVGERYETKRHPTERSPEQAKRRTYLIDPDGRIAKSYRVRDIAGHPDEVLEDLGRLGAAAPA